MDTEDRSPTPALIAEIEGDAKRFSFFQIVDTLLKHRGVEIKDDALSAQPQTGLVFRTSPSLGFAASDVESVHRVATKEGEDYHEITTNFLGLHGASSPMPGYFLDGAVWSRNQDGVQQAFQDFFSNRLNWLFYLIWRKYRYYIRYRADARDRFSECMFAFAGIGAPEMRGKTGITWAKLLTYIGLIAARTRSPDMTAGVIAHAFNLPDVSIEQLVLRKVEIPEDQKMCLGGANCRLGEDAVIGDWAEDRMGKFTVIFRELNFQRFRDFLPIGKDFAPFKELVEFLLKDQLAYDLVLHTMEHERPAFVLGDEQKGRLGWTSFIGEPKGPHEKSVVIPARL